MVLWGKASNILCKFCLDTQTVHCIESVCIQNYSARHLLAFKNYLGKLLQRTDFQLGKTSTLTCYSNHYFAVLRKTELCLRYLLDVYVTQPDSRLYCNVEYSHSEKQCIAHKSPNQHERRETT